MDRIFQTFLCWWHRHLLLQPLLLRPLSTFNLFLKNYKNSLVICSRQIKTISRTELSTLSENIVTGNSQQIELLSTFKHLGLLIDDHFWSAVCCSKKKTRAPTWVLLQKLVFLSMWNRNWWKRPLYLWMTVWFVKGTAVHLLIIVYLIEKWNGLFKVFVTSVTGMCSFTKQLCGHIYLKMET